MNKRQQNHEATRAKVLAACEVIAEGNTATAAIRELGLSNATFYNYLSNDLELQRTFAFARRCQVEVLVAEIVTIADTDPDPQRAKNRIHARQWYASKLVPSVYGDKLQVDAQITGISLRAILAQAEARRLRPQNAHGEVIDLHALPGEQPSGLDDLLS